MHAYKSPGTYTVSIYGDFARIHLPDYPANAPKLQSIEQWGDIRWETMRGAFSGASNMVYRAADAPDLSAVTDMSEMFRFASMFDGDLSGWDTSSVTDMSQMFTAAATFNGDISGWDVSSVADMSGMFLGAHGFARNLGPWYVVLDGADVPGGGGNGGGGNGGGGTLAIRAQNAWLDGQGPAYAVDGTAPGGSLFEVADGALAVRAGQTPAPGAYNVTVTSAGGFGTGNSMVVGIAVGEDMSLRIANRPPAADAGPDLTVTEGGTAALAGTAADPDGDPVTYLWTHDSALDVRLADATAPSTTLAAPQVDRDTAILLTLTVTDRHGAAASDTAEITITNANRPPTADAGPDLTVTEGGTAALAGTAADPDGDSVTYLWTHDSTLDIVLADATAPSTTLTAPQVDQDTAILLTLTVTDQHGATASDSATITVTPGEPEAAGVVPALAGIRDQTVPELSTLRFAAGVTNGHLLAAPLTYGLEGGPAGASMNPATGEFEWTPTEIQDGGHVVTVTVSDRDGRTGSQDVVVMVREVNTAPTLGEIPDQTVDASSALAFNASATDGDLHPGVRTETVAENLSVPWSIGWTPDGTALFTERGGNLSMIQNGIPAPGPLLSLNVSGGEGGLLGVAVDPDFAKNSYVYLYYSTAGADHAFTNKVVRYLFADGTVTEDAILVDGIPGARYHDGGRIQFGPDGYLYVTTGDAGVPALAQDLGSLAGKILRMDRDGGVPADNPFANSTVWSAGHRNSQGIDWDERGNLVATEHGPSGGQYGRAHDEINVIVPGANYGWPAIVGGGYADGMRAPILHTGTDTWAPSGAEFYDGGMIPGWAGKYFVATLRGAHLHMVDLDLPNGMVVSHEPLFQGEFGRLRDVQTGPDGYLYLLTSNRDGRGTPVPGDDRILRVVLSGDADRARPANALTYGLEGAPRGASIDPASGAFSWEPAEGRQPGTVTFNVTVSDGRGGTDAQPVRVRVTEGPGAPGALPAAPDRNATAVLEAPEPRGSRDIGRITLDSAAPGTIDASWEAPAEDPANYRIMWAKVGEPFRTWTDPTGNAFPTIPSHAITDLEEGAEYKVKIRAAYAGTSGGWSGELTVTVAGSPANRPPAVEAGPDLTVTEGGTAALAGTAADPDGDPMTYLWTHDGALPVALANATALSTSFAAPAVGADATVTLTLTATDRHGAAASDTVTVTVLAGPPPAAPQNLRANSTTSTAVTLAWDDPGDPSITGYKILSRTPATQNHLSTLVGDTGSPAASYVVEDLNPATVYVFRVAAINGHGESGLSNFVRLSTGPAAGDPPATPQNLRANSTTSTAVTLAWDDPGDPSITGYKILSRTPATQNHLSTLVGDTGSPAASYVVEDLNPATVYVFRVAAINGHGESGLSNFVRLSTAANYPPYADAGPPQVVREGDTVTLSGSATDRNNDPLAYLWTHDAAGLAIDFENATSAATTFNAPQVDHDTAILLTLTATDPHGAADSDRVFVIVADAPAAAQQQQGSPEPEGAPGPRDIGRITLNSTAPGTIDASWEAPAEEPVDYRIAWAKTGEPFRTWTDLTGNAFPTIPAHTITDLEEGAEYKITVRARYGGSSGDWSDAATVRVTGAAPEPSEGAPQ